METLWQDVKYGTRQLARSPGFTAVALLTLALGIGANTAIFQLVNAVRLRTLPVENPEELAGIQIADMTGARGSFNFWHPPLTNAVWERIREEQTAFSGVFAWARGGVNIAPSGEARYVEGLWVSGEFFSVLGVRSLLGRVFTTADDQRGCGSSGAVVSHSFWQREYGGDPSAVGRTLTIEGHPFEIVGVTPPSFFGLEVGRGFDLAIPLCAETILQGESSRLDSGTSWWLVVMGRRKPSVSLEQAAAHLRALSPGIFEATLPKNYPAENIKDYLGFKLTAIPAGTGISRLRETYSTPLWLLLGLAGSVLLIACANLANLMLTRAGAREREIAVRLALGATRGRLIRQLLAESLLLAAVGAGIALVLAQDLSRFLVLVLNTEDDPLFVSLILDWRVLAFTGGLTVLTSVLFGLTPALRGTRTDPGVALKSGGRRLTPGRERFGLRRALVVAQVAVSLVLLVGALLFARSLQKLMTVDAGFQQDGILIATVDLGRLKVPADRRQPFKQELTERIGSLPGVDSAADTYIVPLGGFGWGNDVWKDGADSQQRTNASLTRVSPGYFKTLGIRLRTGRDFDNRDGSTSPKVAIVTETLARQLGGGANMVGERFWVQATPREPETVYEIIGVVNDTKYLSLREDFRPIAYFPTSQDPHANEYAQLLIRSSGPLGDLRSRVSQALADVNPNLVVSYQVFGELIRNSLVQERLMAILASFFGALAGLLAAVGLYGVVSYMVAQRTNEIGIRIALGAYPRTIFLMVMREVVVLLAIGLGAGAVLALAGARITSALLFGLRPNDPATFLVALALLAATAVAACYLPARRATRIDPMVALRYE
jgi:predicted permease